MFLEKILIFIFISSNAFTGEYLQMKDLPYSSSEKGHLKNGALLIESDVKEFKFSAKKKGQSFVMKGAGLHKRSCSKALRVLSRYQDYSKYLSFIKTSEYSDKTQRLNFLLSHILLPFDMRLYFKIKRITSPGIYVFIFDRGFLKDLIGQIHVSSYKNRCLFYAHIFWKGEKTSVPSSVLEFFSEALGKMAIRNLFKISGSSP